MRFITIALVALEVKNAGVVRTLKDRSRLTPTSSIVETKAMAREASEPSTFVLPLATCEIASINSDYYLESFVIVDFDS